MTLRQRQYWCRRCDGPRLFGSNGVNHILHLVLTLGSMWIASMIMCLPIPFWLPIWGLMAMFGGDPWRCQMCGSAPANPPNYPRKWAGTDSVIRVDRIIAAVILALVLAAVGAIVLSQLNPQIFKRGG